MLGKNTRVVFALLLPVMVGLLYMLSVVVIDGMPESFFSDLLEATKWLGSLTLIAAAIMLFVSRTGSGETSDYALAGLVAALALSSFFAPIGGEQSSLSRSIESFSSVNNWFAFYAAMALVSTLLGALSGLIMNRGNHKPLSNNGIRFSVWLKVLGGILLMFGLAGVYRFSTFEDVNDEKLTLLYASAKAVLLGVFCLAITAIRYNTKCTDKVLITNLDNWRDNKKNLRRTNGLAVLLPKEQYEGSLIRLLSMFGKPSVYDLTLRHSHFHPTRAISTINTAKTIFVDIRNGDEIKPEAQFFIEHTPKEKLVIIASNEQKEWVQAALGGEFTISYIDDNTEVLQRISAPTSNQGKTNSSEIQVAAIKATSQYVIQLVKKSLFSSIGFVLSASTILAVVLFDYVIFRFTSNNYGADWQSTETTTIAINTILMLLGVSAVFNSKKTLGEGQDSKHDLPVYVGSLFLVFAYLSLTLMPKLTWEKYYDNRANFVDYRYEKSQIVAGFYDWLYKEHRQLVNFDEHASSFTSRGLYVKGDSQEERESNLIKIRETLASNTNWNEQFALYMDSANGIIFSEAGPDGKIGNDDDIIASPHKNTRNLGGQASTRPTGFQLLTFNSTLNVRRCRNWDVSIYEAGGELAHLYGSDKC